MVIIEGVISLLSKGLCIKCLGCFYLKTRSSSAAPAPVQCSVSRALHCHRPLCGHPPPARRLGPGHLQHWCWVEAPLYTLHNLPISTASHCHCAAPARTHAPLYANTAGRSAACGVVAGQGVWESGAPSEINSTLPPPLTLPTIQGRLVLCYPTRVALNMLCDVYLLFYCLHTNLSLYEMYECPTHAKCLTDYFLFSFSP